MSALQFAVNRITMNCDEEINLTKSEKMIHAYKVLREWPSTMEQIHLGQLYNSEQGIHLGEKLWTNQQYSALKLDISERYKLFDEFSNNISARLPLFHSSNLDTIEKELVHLIKEHYSTKQNHYIMNLLNQPILSDIAGIQDYKSYSPGCTITSQKIFGYQNG